MPTPFRKPNMLNVAMEQLNTRFNAIVRVSVTSVVVAALLCISTIVGYLFAIEDPVAQLPNRLVLVDVLRTSVALNHKRGSFELSIIFCFEPLARWVGHAGRLQVLRRPSWYRIRDAPWKLSIVSASGAACCCQWPSSYRVSSSKDRLVSVSVRRPA